MAVKKKQVTTKVKKKHWVLIAASKHFNEQIIGETPVFDTESVIGRHIVVNLAGLARDMKKQNINVRFKVDAVKGDKAQTKVIGYEMIASTIKRLIRRGRDRIDESFKVETKDSHSIQLKPLIITKNQTSRSVQSKIRHESKKILSYITKELPYEIFVNNLLSHKIQKELRDRLNKIYPLRTCEIRIMSLLNENGTALENPEVEEIPKQEAKPAEA